MSITVLGEAQERPLSRVHDIKVETLARCGAGWQPARRLATAAVRCQRGNWQIENRPQLSKLPHKSPRCLAYTYPRIQAVLLMNGLGVHFCVAHPLVKLVALMPSRTLPADAASASAPPCNPGTLSQSPSPCQ